MNEKNPTVSKNIYLLLSIASGIVVANIYYIQPLLGQIASYFSISQPAAGLMATLTQLGYALGLFFLIPIADLMERKKLVLIMLAFSAIALLLMILSTSYTASLLIALAIGMTSIVPQLMIPLGAQLSLPEERGKNIGTIMSGLLIGILLSRVLSGILGNYAGWKAIYIFAFVMILILFVLLYHKLPTIQSKNTISYTATLKSMLSLPKKYPALVFASINGALVFAIFSAFWTVLTFYLESSRFGFGSNIIGLFGLLGVAGASLAPIAGKMSDKKGSHFTILFHLFIIILSVICFLLFGSSILGLVVGIILLDWGVQSCNVANQSLIQNLSESMRNRITSIYMVSFFIGGSIGTSLGSAVYQAFHWYGFVVLAAILILTATILHLFVKIPKPNTCTE